MSVVEWLWDGLDMAGDSPESSCFSGLLGLAMKKVCLLLSKHYTIEAQVQQ